MKDKYDVIVAGSGSAGLAAALASARQGASTLLVERYGYLGGMLTAGLVAHYDPIDQIEASGIAREIYERLKERGAIKEFDMTGIEMPFRFWQGGCGIDAEEYKNLAFDMVKEAGVDLLLHTWVTGAIKEGDSVTGIEVFNKSGRKEIYAKNVVDATGDADIAAMAGVPFSLGDEDGIMSSTLCFTIGGADMEKLYAYLEENPDELGNHPRLGKYIRDPRKSSILQGFYKLIRKAKEAGDLTIELPEPGVGMVVLPMPGTLHVNAIRQPGMNTVDAEDLTTMEIKQHEAMEQLVRFMRKYIPGLENVYVLASAALVGVRESRRIHGEYQMTIDDIKNGTPFSDAIVRTKWGHTDVHSGKSMQWSFEFIEGPYYIPYRSLVPLKVDNLLVVGRCISATKKAMASIRIMPLCSMTGEAAGTAAAMAAKKGIRPRDIDTDELRGVLRKNGVVL